jgi:hypothetical protein
MSDQAAPRPQSPEAESLLRYHIFQLDLPPDGCYLFTFSCPERPSTYSNALLVRHGKIVGLTEYVPVLLSSSEDGACGLAITQHHLTFRPDGSVGSPDIASPGIAMRLKNPERATMTWEPLMPVQEADAALKGLRQRVTAVIDEFLDRPGHCGPLEGFAACERAMDAGHFGAAFPERA